MTEFEKTFGTFNFNDFNFKYPPLSTIGAWSGLYSSSWLLTIYLPLIEVGRHIDVYMVALCVDQH